MADAKKHEEPKSYLLPEEVSIAADPVLEFMSKPALQKALKETEKAMHRAAKDMDFLEAARLRDQLEIIKEKIGK